ncbi:MAG: leucine-rich repeat domain-containing protein, partial [Prevotella sp.]|nr:leucine-rich repeat domain-containing protein [Prevotella sp.]
MKRTLLLILIFLPVLASADAIEIDGIYYNLDNEAKTAEVTSKPDRYKDDVIIPETVRYNETIYNVTSIGDIAFAGCSGLISISIPNGVTSIGKGAFSECRGLISITIPDGVTLIGESAFDHCSGLTSVAIPNSVTSIGEIAFSYCRGLTSVTIPNSVTSIGKLAFSYCSSLTSIKVEAENTKYDSRDNCNAIIETESNTLIAGCQKTTIPNSVTAIGEYAFYGCDGLTSVIIPNGVTSIGDFAFYDCIDLTSVTIPNGTTSIGDYAFSGCSGLTSIAIGNGVTSIGKNAFIGCSGLISIDIPEGVTSIGDCAFLGCSGLTSITIPNSVISISRETFSGCSGLTSITIPGSVNSIGFGAFAGCSGLTSITIPNSVIEIGSYAFSQCSSLTSVTIPNSITSISNGAFFMCSGLTSVTIPDGVTSIGSSAFQDCSGLTSITIPDGVTSIGTWAFASCSGMSDLFCRAKDVPKTGTDAFYNCNKATLHVPAASVSAYQATEPWKNFKEIVALPAQEDDTDNFNYIPFVKDSKGKRWHVVRSELNSSHTEQYMLAYEEVVKDGKTYLKMCRNIGDRTEIQDMGLFREEDRKVYFIAPDMQEEHLMFDFSLKEGDTYETYSYDEEKMVSYEVVSVEDYLEGPEYIHYIEKEDGLITQHRYLRKWIVCRTDDKSIQKVWIEGVGSLEGPLENLYDEVSTSARSYLAYVEDAYAEDPDYDNLYLPFTINDVYGHVHGCDLPTEADNQTEYDEHHRLTYELEGERLHVYGEVFGNCGPNQYAYFREKPTDDPLVHKIEFEIQEVAPLYWCEGLHATDFYVSGFDPNLNYIVVDNQGVEHQVINKT